MNEVSLELLGPSLLPRGESLPENGANSGASNIEADGPSDKI